MVGVAIRIGAGVEDFQCAYATLDGPIGIAEVIRNFIVGIALDLIFIQIRITKKHTVRVQVLPHVRDVHRPVLVDVKQGTDTRTSVFRLVDIVFLQRLSIEECDPAEIGAGLKTAATI